LALAAAIGFSGYHFYAAQKRVIELEVRQQLTEVADLKVNQVAAWRLERVGDASVAVADTRLMPDVQQVLGSQDNSASRQRVLAWMDAMRANYEYANVILSDSSGRIRLTSGQLMGTPEFYKELTREVAQYRGVGFKDRPRDATVSMPHFTLGIGLKSENGVAFGTLTLGIDPWTSLYPTILKWPASSRSGEAILVRQDRDEVLYLSELRGELDSAMDLRDSLAKRTSPVVRAVLGHGIADGIDDIGNAVFASARSVPGSDWFVVAKVDKEEAYAPLRDSEMLILLVGGLLILMCAAGVGLIWRHQVAVSYRQQFEAEQKRRALLGHYDYLTRYANDVVFLLDQDGAIVEANERATESFGYSKEELLKLNIRDLKNPEALAEFQQTWDTLHKQGHLIFETTNQRKDGSVFAGWSVLHRRQWPHVYAGQGGCDSVGTGSKPGRHLFGKTRRTERGGYYIAKSDDQSCFPSATDKCSDECREFIHPASLQSGVPGHHPRNGFADSFRLQWRSCRSNQRHRQRRCRGSYRCLRDADHLPVPKPEAHSPGVEPVRCIERRESYRAGRGPRNFHSR